MSRKCVQEERKQQILEALHRCLLKKPFDKTSIKEIASEAGVNHGVLHYYFKSKEDILLHYIEYVIELYKGLFEDWLQSEGCKIENSQDFLRECCKFVTRKITLNQDLTHTFIEIWEIAIYNPKVKKKLQKAYLEWVETVRSMIVASTGNEETASIASIGGVAFLEGISLLSVVIGPKYFDFESVLREVQTIFLDTLAKP